MSVSSSMAMSILVDVLPILTVLQGNSHRRVGTPVVDMLQYI